MTFRWFFFKGLFKSAIRLSEFGINHPLEVIEGHEKELLKKTSLVISRFSNTQKMIVNVKNPKTRFLSDSGIICVEIKFGWKLMQTWFSTFKNTQKMFLNVKNPIFIRFGYCMCRNYIQLKIDANMIFYV